MLRPMARVKSAFPRTLYYCEICAHVGLHLHKTWKSACGDPGRQQGQPVAQSIFTAHQNLDGIRHR